MSSGQVSYKVKNVLMVTSTNNVFTCDLPAGDAPGDYTGFALTGLAQLDGSGTVITATVAGNGDITITRPFNTDQPHKVTVQY